MSKFRFDDVTSKQAIDMYLNQGMTTVEIADYFHCHDSTVGRMLRSHNIDVNTLGNIRKCKIPREEWDKIKHYYINENMTTIEIGHIYHVADNTIAKILRKLDVEVRKSMRRSQIKHHDFFHTIDAKQKAYFLGWMISDGAVIEHKTRPDRSDTISLEIQTTDKYILEMFANEIGSTKEHVFDTIRKDGCHHSYFRFASQEMADDLKQYGVIYRKSHFAYLPKLDDAMMPHLIRGIFDGDGTNYIQNEKYLRFGFYGSYDVCSQIQEYLYEKINVNINTVFNRTDYGSQCYMILYSGNEISQKFYNLIYDDCDIYYLKRKRDKFEKILCA